MTGPSAPRGAIIVDGGCPVAPVLVADDHPLFRQGLQTVLAHEADIDVVDDAGDGAEAVDKAMELAADVVLLDLHMPIAAASKRAQ